MIITACLCLIGCKPPEFVLCPILLSVCEYVCAEYIMYVLYVFLEVSRQSARLGVRATEPTASKAATERSGGAHRHSVYNVARVDHFEQQRPLERQPELVDDHHKGGARARACAEQ